jgi:hypothetical protein
MSKRDLQILCRGLLIKLSAIAKIAILAMVIAGWIAAECGSFGCAWLSVAVGAVLLGAVMFIDKLLY